MIYEHDGKKPQIHETAMVSDSAVLIGDVTIGKDTSVWPNATLRSDANFIRIGEGTSIQDNVCIHEHPQHPTIIGDYVTVGHGAIVHGATVESECLIGMGSIVLDGAHIGRGALVGAGCLVPPGMEVPPFTQVVGVPAKIVKKLPETQAEHFHAEAADYVALKNNMLGVLDKEKSGR